MQTIKNYTINGTWSPTSTLSEKWLIVNTFKNIWGDNFEVFDTNRFRILLENAIIDRGNNRILSPRFKTFASLQQSTLNWLEYKKDELTRFLNVILSDYNPLENYDKKSTITSVFGEQVNNTLYGELVNTLVNGVQKSTNTHSENAFNSSTPVDKAIDVTDIDSATNTNTTGTHTDRNTLGSHTDIVTDNTHGNIGVTTFADMYDQFTNIMMSKPVITFIADSWIDNYTIGYSIEDLDID